MNRSYANGETIFRQGDRGGEMYVIRSGKVEIVRSKDGREVKLATLGTDDFFGEMALFDEEPRSGTARASGVTTVEVVTKERFRDSIDDPLAWAMLTAMSQRIRQVDRALEQLDTEDQARKEHLSGIITSRRQFL
jgi:CRP/FNR family cyclic AMP-dependent transcriptional regulator